MTCKTTRSVQGLLAVITVMLQGLAALDPAMLNICRYSFSAGEKKLENTIIYSYYIFNFKSFVFSHHKEKVVIKIMLKYIMGKINNVIYLPSLQHAPICNCAGFEQRFYHVIHYHGVCILRY